MPRYDDPDRLRHMLGAARKAVAFCAGKARGDLDGDEMRVLALVRLVEIIGEAARSVSSQTRAKAATVPWREITGTRDRLVHGYAEVNLDILWEIVTRDLPPLIAEIERLLSGNDN